MRILVLGTSQAGSLAAAHEAEPSILESFGEVGFYVVPGGTGPTLTVEGKRLRLDEEDARFPAFRRPTDLDLGDLDDWNVVVIGGIGFVDGGYAYRISTVEQGLLFNCKPKESSQLRLLSEPCYRHILDHMLDGHPGIALCRQLRQATSARLIIQPSPLLSAEMPGQAGWTLAQLYHDCRRANAFFTDARMRFLERLGRDTRAEVLPFPDLRWLESGFTPEEFMATWDGVHGNLAYGRLVLTQIAATLSASSAS